MASRLANMGGPSPHTAGIFSDMTVDGPEIGTLVVIVDRAKNLPNRKTMGKQNPYCAARLGKEAKKTETDKRGGQTPKWDQELRFTVHESLDYHTLKISIFSEDKRATDLIGEALVSLDNILVPGGGKEDIWQGLNCKGKYAGELRVELTYYDTRPKLEATGSVAGSEDMRQSVDGNARVKRRPLPNNPNGNQNSRHVTPDTIPQPAVPSRAKHGPRDFHTPPRAYSMPPEVHTSYPFSPHLYTDPSSAHPSPKDNLPAAPIHHLPPDQRYPGHDQYPEPAQHDDDAQSQPPDFLPQLPPSNRSRTTQPRFDGRAQPPQMHHPRPPIGLPHTQSAPVIPQAEPESIGFDEPYQLRTDYPDPIPDLDYQHRQIRQRRNDVPPGWQDEFGGSYPDKQAYVEDDNPAPPPPMHSASAPVVPHFVNGHVSNGSSPVSAYGTSPPGIRHNSVPNSSPLQNVERYGPTQRTHVHRHPQRGGSMDSYTPPREPTTYGGSPVGYAPEQSPSPYARQQPPPRTLPHRNSIAIPYNTTPSRPTPLSQEVPRARSPQPGYNPPQRSPQPFGHSPYQHEQPIYDSMPPNQRRSVSPLPAPRSAPNTDPRPKSSYALQHPVHAFESSDGSPLSTSQQDPRQARSQGRGVPVRKSVSPNPSPGGSAPFSPDDFGVHNPYARPPPTANSASPHSPYQIRPGSEAYARDDTKGPIVGWHGQEIDPSDHLPVDSWAPEPEKKTPAKTYGLGRNRDFGPRTAESSGERNLSRDTKINVRMKPAPSPPANPYSQPPPPETSPTKGKLQKKPGRSPGIEPLREHHNYNSVSVPDPYAQTQDYSRGFYGGRAEGGYGAAALEREISSIDLGHSSRGHVRQGSAPPAQAPVSYVPVRSQRDRYTYY